MTENAAQPRAPSHGLDFSVPIPDEILDSSPVCSMLQTAQNVAEMYDISREELDEFAVESHRKYGEALASGFYQGEIVPIEVEMPVFDDEGNLLLDERGDKRVVEVDEGFRPGTNFEGLSGLRTVRGTVSHTQSEIRITAGNSCPTNDGFTAALLMSERKADELGLEPLARIAGFGVGGVKPQVMGLGPDPRDPQGAWPTQASTPPTSTASSSTKPSPPRSSLPSRNSGSTWTRSTSTAVRWPSATRSAPPAPAWSRPSPASSSAPAASTVSPPSASVPAWASRTIIEAV